MNRLSRSIRNQGVTDGDTVSNIKLDPALVGKQDDWEALVREVPDYSKESDVEKQYRNLFERMVKEAPSR